jgi:hypothetical protein
MCSCQRTPAYFAPGKALFQTFQGAFQRNLFSLRPPLKLVGVTGLEPVTLRLSSACSNQLSYTPMSVGGAEEIRTPDL